MCLRTVNTAQGRGRRGCRHTEPAQHDAGRGQGSAGLHRVMLAEGRAQQGCCFSPLLRGQEISEYSSGHADELTHFFRYASFFSFGSTLLHGLKTSHNALATEPPEGLSCLESPTPEGRESHVSERDGSFPGDTLLFHSDTGNMTFKMGPVRS